MMMVAYNKLNLRANYLRFLSCLEKIRPRLLVIEQICMALLSYNNRNKEGKN